MTFELKRVILFKQSGRVTKPLENELPFLILVLDKPAQVGYNRKPVRTSSGNRSGWAGVEPVKNFRIVGP